MKYIKAFGLAAMTAIAIMALAGTASATVATSPEGTAYTGTIKAESETAHVDLTGPLGLHLQCNSSGEGKLESHGPSSTVRGSIAIEGFPFTNCTNGYHVTTLKGKEGELEVHTEAGSSNGNGTLTSHNAEFEVKVPAGTTCIYKTTNTDIGVLTGSNKNKATAHIKALVPRTGGSALCGSVGELQASYLITTPSTLYID